MAKKLIDRIKDSLAKKGFEPRSRDARTWLREEAARSGDFTKVIAFKKQLKNQS